MTGKSQAIRRAQAQVKMIQAKRRDRDQVRIEDNTRLLAFGVCDSVAYTTKSTGSFAPRSKFCAWTTIVWVIPSVAALFALLVAVTR